MGRGEPQREPRQHGVNDAEPDGQVAHPAAPASFQRHDQRAQPRLTVSRLFALRDDGLAVGGLTVRGLVTARAAGSLGWRGGRLDTHDVFWLSARSNGNRMTSRIDGWPVSVIVKRSMPIPRPAAGGIPCSSARM